MQLLSSASETPVPRREEGAGPRLREQTCQRELGKAASLRDPTGSLVDGLHNRLGDLNCT